MSKYPDPDPDLDPAFPQDIRDLHYFGLSVRDYFAAAALTGLVVAEEISFADAAELAYKAADMMIIERNKSR